MAECLEIFNGKVRLLVKFYARPASETVILLHGGPGVPDEMTEVREVLSETIQVITFDQRGTGNQGQNCTFSIPDYLSDINRIAHFFQLEKFHLFGHSWGGLYAQIYAAEYPEKIQSLFLCSPASGTGDIWRLTEREVFRYNRLRSTNLDWILMGLNSLLGFLGSDKAYRRLYKQIIINYHKGFNVAPPEPEKLAKINAKAGNLTRQSIKNFPPLKPFIKTNFPVIVTYGDADAYGDSKKYLLQRFPETTPVIIPRCGHTPWKHQPDFFFNIVKNFYHMSGR